MAPSYPVPTSLMNSTILTRSSNGIAESAASWYTFEPNREGDNSQPNLNSSIGSASASDLYKEAEEVASQIASQISQRSNHGLQHPSESIKVLALGFSAGELSELEKALKIRGWTHVPHVPLGRRDAQYYCYSESQYGGRVTLLVVGLVILTGCGGYFAIRSTKRGVELARVIEERDAALRAITELATATPTATLTAAPNWPMRLAEIVDELTQDPPPAYSDAANGVNRGPDANRRLEEVPEASGVNPFAEPPTPGDVAHEPGAIELSDHRAQ